MPSIIRQGTVYGVPAKLGGLTDVTLSTLSAGQSLVYDATLGAWVNGEGGGKVFYGYCSTAPTTSGTKKIWSVTLINGDNFALATGVTVHIKFDYASDGSAYPTPNLNVNSTGNKPIYINDPLPPSSGIAPRWREGQLCVFTYDGSSWLLVNTVQNAYRTPYSNSSSGLTATDVQSAIDEVNTKTNLITDLGNAGRIQVIQGNKSYTATETLSGYNYPYSILIIGYNSLALVHAIKTYLPLSGITKVYGTGTDSCSLNTSTGVLTTGSDGNRQFTCIMPRNIILVEQTS